MTDEQKNKFIHILTGNSLKEANYFTPDGFYTVWQFIENKWPEFWGHFMYHKITEIVKGFQEIHDLNNLIPFLVDHVYDWGWEDTPACKDYPNKCAICREKSICSRVKKIKHPAYLYLEEIGGINA